MEVNDDVIAAQPRLNVTPNLTRYERKLPTATRCANNHVGPTPSIVESVILAVTSYSRCVRRATRAYEEVPKVPPPLPCYNGSGKLVGLRVIEGF